MSGTNNLDERAEAQATHEKAQHEAHIAALRRERGFYELQNRSKDVAAVDRALKAANAARETAVTGDADRVTAAPTDGANETATSDSTEKR